MLPSTAALYCKHTHRSMEEHTPHLIDPHTPRGKSNYTGKSCGHFLSYDLADIVEEIRDHTDGDVDLNKVDRDHSPEASQIRPCRVRVSIKYSECMWDGAGRVMHAHFCFQHAA
mgnify:CR=1 FL=1